MAPLLQIDEPPLPPQRRWALWALGFRPFYLLASVLAALSVPLWALQYAGLLQTAYLRGPLWHAHEMLFGFALAVVTGFLLTAGRNWSNQPTPSGRSLQALAALWLAGRVLVLTPWDLAAAVVNVAFPLAAAWGLGRALWAGRNRRNYFFVGLLGLLAAAAALVHAVQLGWLAGPGTLGLQAGLDGVLVIMAVMGGRVIPMFTNNGVPQARAQRHAWLERASVASVAALLAADLLLGATGVESPASIAVLTTAAAVLHALRWWRWQPWTTLRVPLVWVLHAAYAWIPVHLLLRAASAAGWIAAGPAVHALTVGAIGTLTLGMMTRTARGHTGRPLLADRADVACYVLVLAAAVLRVAVPLVLPSAQVASVLASALLWSAAFGLYALHYVPWLCRARLDGRPG
jgi:uncharacterized protein involved in response to NO